MPGKYLTISVDDGHPDDLRVAELLAKHGLKATFYIPARNPERELLPASRIRELGREFEIGAHTYNHKPLKGLPPEETRAEVEDGKDWLEQLLGAPVRAFCYPRGKMDRRAVEAVERAGFVGARTCQWNRMDFPAHPQRWGLGTQARSHPRRVQIQHAAVEGNWRGLVNFLGPLRATVDWARHFARVVNRVERRGGVAHLYLHGWEIAAADHWRQLEAVFDFIQEREGFTRLTNGELFELWHGRVEGRESRVESQSR
jgi:peptidoglycan/xylan/chitin deacetylase (PgdA/CDA1 family)